MATTRKKPVAKPPVPWYDTPGLREHFGACQVGWNDAKPRFSKFATANEWWQKCRPSVTAADDMDWFLSATSRHIQNSMPAIRYYGGYAGWRLAKDNAQVTPAQRMKLMRHLFPDIPVSRATQEAFPAVFNGVWGFNSAN